MKRPMTAASARQYLNGLPDVDLLRAMYCYQTGSTFVRMNLMEDAVIQAMSICDRVKVDTTLGPDAPAWHRMVRKTERLQGSTLGNLIGILSRHGVQQQDLAYLRWVKDKRDYFVHRQFRETPWPGELGEDGLLFRYRGLLYLEFVFGRAAHRIWRIFARANLMAMADLGRDGVLMMNINLLSGEEG